MIKRGFQQTLSKPNTAIVRMEQKPAKLGTLAVIYNADTADNFPIVLGYPQSVKLGIIILQELIKRLRDIAFKCR